MQTLWLTHFLHTFWIIKIQSTNSFTVSHVCLMHNFTDVCIFLKILFLGIFKIQWEQQKYNKEIKYFCLQSGFALMILCFKDALYIAKFVVTIWDLGFNPIPCTRASITNQNNLHTYPYTTKLGISTPLWFMWKINTEDKI